MNYIFTSGLFKCQYPISTLPIDILESYVEFAAWINQLHYYKTIRYSTDDIIINSDIITIYTDECIDEKLSDECVDESFINFLSYFEIELGDKISYLYNDEYAKTIKNMKNYSAIVIAKEYFSVDTDVHKFNTIVKYDIPVDLDFYVLKTDKLLLYNDIIKSENRKSIDYLYDNNKLKSSYFMYKATFFAENCSNFYLLKWMYESNYDNSMCNGRSLLYYPIKFNNILLVEWMLEMKIETTESLYFDCIESENLVIFKKLYNSGCKLSSAVFNSAIKKMYFPIIKYLYFVDCPHDQLLTVGLMTKNVEIINYIHDNNLCGNEYGDEYGDELYCVDIVVIDAYYKFNNVENHDYVEKSKNMKIVMNYNDYSFLSIIDSECDDKIDVLEWMFYNGYEVSDIIMFCVVYTNNVSLVKWCHKNYCELPNKLLIIGHDYYNTNMLVEIKEYYGINDFTINSINYKCHKDIILFSK